MNLTRACCVQEVECAEGSVCTITSHTVCELDMCHLEYSGQCVGQCILAVFILCHFATAFIAVCSNQFNCIVVGRTERSICRSRFQKHLFWTLIYYIIHTMIEQ